MARSWVAITAVAALLAIGVAGLFAIGTRRSDEPVPAQSPVAPTQPTESSAATTSTEDLNALACGGASTTAATLADAQFAFIGTITEVEDAVHPWTTDPENPDRPNIATPTPWVTFDIERWYLRDWGLTFSVWIPDLAVRVGQRLAVGGNAYHTNVNGFSGQSGEVEFCSPIADTEDTVLAWETQLGASVTPSPPTSPPITVVLPATKVFGEHDDPCEPTTLNHEPEDQQTLATGAACFLAEHDAGRAVIWDVLYYTPEGDPIVSRYDYDGTAITITRDHSFDTLGSGRVYEQRCTSVRSTDWLPEGVDCTTSTGEGFDAASLN
jgi:hypothetical protein